MSFKQKTWTDRISEHPNRRTLTDVSDNTTKTVIVAREEGTISQEGDAYSAANMNDLEQRVADGFSTLSQDSVKIATKNTTSDSIAFGIDSNGNYGYIKKGADTVTPFKSQKDIDNAYNSGVSAADKRVNTSSASYNQGVTDADKRVNTSSASYNSGYANAGFRLIVDQMLYKEGAAGGDNRNASQSYTLTATQTTWWCAGVKTNDSTKTSSSGQGSGILYAGQSRTFTINASQTNGAYGHIYMHIAAWVKA